MDKTGFCEYGRSPPLERALCGGLGALMLAVGCGGGDSDPASVARESPNQALASSGVLDELAYVATYLHFPGGNTGQPDSLPAWSPDGKQLAFTRGSDIWKMDAASNVPVNLSNHPLNDVAPAWSPDASKIAFTSDRDGPVRLYLMNADGSSPHGLTSQAVLFDQPTWSPNGQRIAFTCMVESGNTDLCAIDADGTGFARLTTHPARDFAADWSPDGTKILFATDRYSPNGLGPPQLAVMQAGGSGVTAVGGGILGYDPDWSPDGSRIVFVWPMEEYPVGWFDVLWVISGNGTEQTELGYGSQPAWRPTSASPPNPPPANRPPTLAPVANQSHPAGQAVSLALSASDPDGDTLTYYASGLPPGLTLNATSGSIDGTPTGAGTYGVSAQVGDGRGGSASRTFTWTITPPPNKPPALAPVATQSHRVGQAVSLALSASDPNGDAPSFSASGLPPGLTINATSGAIAGTPTRSGSYSVTARVSDGRGGSAKRTFTWRITR